MAKRSVPVISSDLNNTVSSSDSLDIRDSVLYTSNEQKQKRVRSKFPARIELVGKVSGKQYVWKGAGECVDVEDVDVADLLLKKMGAASCCGATQQANTLFEIV